VIGDIEGLAILTGGRLITEERLAEYGPNEPAPVRRLSTANPLVIAWRAPSQ
jgi:hypothetical protein